MKTKLIAFILIVAFLFSSCQTVIRNESQVYSNGEVVNYADFNCVIVKVTSGKDSYDPETSAKVKEQLDKVLQAEPKLKFTSSVDVDKAYYDYLYNLFRINFTKKKVAETKIDPNFLKLFDGVESKYLLLLNHEGYYRTSGNVFWATMGGIALGIATLGMVIVYPIPSTTRLEYMLVDKNSGKIVFFNFSNIQDDPRKEKYLQKNVAKIRKDLEEQNKK